MDYSAPADAQQQQQYQQQQQQYQQPSDPQHHQQSYDPAAYEAYYAAYPHHYDPSAAAYHHQYYPDAAAAAYHAPAPPAQDAAHYHAPPQHYAPQGEVPAGLNPAAAAAVAALSQLTQFAGNMSAQERARAMGETQDHRPWNGAAAAGRYHQQAPYHPMQQVGAPPRQSVGGRSQYRGGRRGGGPFRGGGGRGTFVHNQPRQEGVPPIRGRGRGRMSRGRGRRSHQPFPDTQLPHTAPAPVELTQAPAPLPAPVVAPKLPRLSIAAWCDICRVDCNSLEILEQHKNGKRHKKTVQRFEEMQAQQRLMVELQAKATEMPVMVVQRVAENKSAQVVEANKVLSQAGEPSKVSITSESIITNLVTSEVVEANKVPAIQTPVLITEQKMEPGTQSQTVGQAAEVVPPDASATEEKQMEGGYTGRPIMNDYDRFDGRRGSKRKMVKFGRGGKRLKSFEPARSKPIERLREQPRFCTLCNVMCDTQAVFDCHLSGKKHISRINRFKTKGAVFGPVSVYIPPNQPTASQGPEPLFYGLKSHELLQQELQVEVPGQQQGIEASQASKGEVTALVLQSECGLEHPKDEGGQGVEASQASKGEVTALVLQPECGLEHPKDEGGQGVEASQASKGEVTALVLQPECGLEHPKDDVPPANGGEQDLTMDPVDQTTITEFKAENQIAVVSEADVLDEAGFTTAEDCLPVPDNGVSFGANVAVPGLDVKEAGDNNEELATEGARANA